jgi:hypothetical protein
VSGLSELLHRYDGHVALLQVTVWVACVAVAARPGLEAWRGQERWLRWTLVGLGVTATAISLLAFPLGRFDALGHEASYYDCFTGVAAPASEQGWDAYVTYPILRWGYWSLGSLIGRDSGPLPLLVLNGLVRGIAVVAFGWLCAALIRRPLAGAVGALLLTLHPVHAYWGAAIFHTTIPWALAAACVLLAVLAWRSGDGRLMLGAAASGSLMVTMRIEWGLLAPALLLLLLGLGAGWGRSPGVRRLRFWTPGLALALAYGLSLTGSGGSLTEQGGYHGVSGYLESIGRQVLFLNVFEPWNHLWTAPAVGLGLWAWARQEGVGWRPPAALAGFVVIGHVGLTTFNDYGYRHALMPAIGVLVAASAAGALLRHPDRRLVEAARLLLILGAGASALQLATGAGRYYAAEEQFFDEEPGFRSDHIEPASLEDGACYLVTDNERLWELGLAGSHFNLMDPGEAVTRYRAHDGCILWLFDKSQWRWDSLVARARGEKLRFWFDWELIGWTRTDNDGMNALVYRMSTPPWGIADGDPVPETEFLLEQGGGEEEVGGEEERAAEEPIR